MQNWNQWQLSAAPAVSASMPQPPIGYAAPGADPMAVMQSYMQYYNQPAPSGYTAEQWAAAQQQNWAQWQTWQQQYQQWQAQYGEKYQETMKQMSTQNLSSIAQITASSLIQPPPLPKEDTSKKPPLPPEGNTFGFPGIPPPHQNNLPLFPSNKSANPPLPPSQPPPPSDIARNPSIDNAPSGKRISSSSVESVSAKKSKVDDEELTEAEKTFDAQFKQWEEQFNKWKQQNANHPDKTQYKQYEAKWTSWREKLIERREQMRRKREQQRQAAAKAEVDKGKKSLVGDDKILNILTSTENQGLINNLLGIGKTLGLTGKNDGHQGQPQAPMIQPLSAGANLPSTPAAVIPAMGAPSMTPHLNQAAWAAQQWAAQYNAGMNITNYAAGYQQPPAVSQHPTSMPVTNFNQPPSNFNQPPTNFSQGNFNQPPSNFAQPAANFSQPPPGIPPSAQSFPTGPSNASTTGPNFSQPPPGFGASNSRQQTDNVAGQRTGQGNPQDQNARQFIPDADQRHSLMTDLPPRDSMNSGNDRCNFDGNRFGGPPPNNVSNMNRGGQFAPNEYGRDGPNKDFVSGNPSGQGNDNFRRDDSAFNTGGHIGNEFRPNDRFGSGFDRDLGGGRNSRDSDNQDSRGNNRIGSDRDNFNSERFGSSNDRFGSNNEIPVSSNERFCTNNDRFGSNNDRFGSNNNRFSSSNDRFGSNNDRFTSDQSKPDSDRFGSFNDRFRSQNDQFAPSSGDRFGSSADRANMGSLNQPNDKFSRPPPDRIDLGDGNRDIGGSNFRSFNKSNQFNPPMDMPPELQKLMEKRKAAIDVFKPSNFSSLLDSNKCSSASTSLSESFRKITGDSPFLPKSTMDFNKKDANLAPKSPMLGSSGASGSGNFDSSRDFRSNNNFQFRGPGEFRSSEGSGDFSPRGMGDFVSRGNEIRPRGTEFTSRDSRNFDTRDSVNMAPRGNEFNSRDSKYFPSRGKEFNARDSKDFAPPTNESDQQKSNGGDGTFETLADAEQRVNDDLEKGNDNSFKDPTSNTGNEQQRESFESSKQATTVENPEIIDSPDKRGNVDGNLKGTTSEQSKSKNDGIAQNVPPLQAPPWMDPEFADDDIVEVPVGESDSKKNTAVTDASKDDTRPSCDSSKPEESEDRPTDAEQKSDVLPFMGENDPKPEDLNMEPPPELPNLGPIIKEFESNPQSKETNAAFDGPPGDFDRQMNFDCSFDSSGMQTRSKNPMPFGVKDPGTSHPTPFEARDIGAGPPENEKSTAGPFGSHCSNNGLQFGARGPQFDSFKPSGPAIGTPGVRSSADTFPRGPGDFGPCPSVFGSRDGTGGFGPQGPGNFGSRGPGGCGPPGPFNSRGPGDFGPRGPGDFGPRGPDNFRPQGNFGPCGPGDFGPRGQADFGSRGPLDFGPCGPSDFHHPRGPMSFGPRDPSDFGSCGPSDFGPRGSSDFGPRGPSDFGPQCGNDRSFGPRGMSPFGPRGPLDRSFGPGNMDSQFSEKPQFGSNTFATGGNFDKPGTGIPSLMSFKLDRPPIHNTDDMPSQKSGSEGNRWEDLPPAFRNDDREARTFGGNEAREEHNTSDHGCGSELNIPRESGGSDWRESFSRNKFGDSDQRSGSLEFNDPSGVRSSAQMDGDKSMLPFVSDRRMQCNDGNTTDQTTGLAFEDISIRPSNNRSAGSSFSARHSTDGRIKESPKDFCVEKQFNYNHGDIIPEKITNEHTPANVIDYAHAPRVIVHDYVTPAQSFDYDHGNLKPIVPDHEIYSKRDFRNWVETEQNLREYTDRMTTYESDMRALKRDSGHHQFDARAHYRERDRIQDDRRSYERDRDRRLTRSDKTRKDREANDYRERDRRRDSRERGRRERERERTSNKQREDRSQHRRSKSKERTRERPEKIRKETNRDNKKDEERSKGSVTDSESLAKKPDESTAPDNSKQESNDGEPKAPPQITEAAKIVEAPKTTELPTTMELPKTPNFTMVDDLLSQPGRQNRPPKIVVILRGPPGSGKSFVAKLIKDKEVEQGGSAPRILSLDDYFLTEKEIESEDNNGKKIITKEMVYEYEEAMEPSYVASLVKAFKKNITDGFFNFIILDSINEKISDYEEMWSFAKTKGFRVYVCEMEMDVQICLKRNIHNRTEDEINRIVDYFEPTPGYHQKLDVTSMLQEEAIEEVHMEDTQDMQEEAGSGNDDSQDSQEEPSASAGISKWERMEAEDKLDRLDGLAKRKNEGKPQTMEDFLQVPDYYNMEDTSGKRRVRWADLEERKEQEKMRAVGFVVGQTNWDRMMDPTMGSSALTQTKYI